MRVVRSPVTKVLCCTAVVGVLAGCGAKHGQKSSQVVATVNDQEVTVMQLNQLLRSSGVSEVTPEVRRKALETLTSEELLVQAALKSNIHRDPAFVQALEQSRRRLLTQFFAEQVVYPKSTITAEQISDYYRSVPLLFAKRRKFRMTTFLTEQADITSAVTTELNAVSSVDQLRQVLESHAIKYVTEMVSVPPEELPVDELATFEKARVGDVLFTPQGGGKTLLMAVTGIEEEVPLSLERAKPLIEAYLKNSHNREAAERYLTTARATAKIEYTDVAPATVTTAVSVAPVEAAPTRTLLRDASAPIEKTGLN